MVALLSTAWLGGVTAVIFTLARLYYALSRGPADVSAALRSATISSPLYWTGVVLAFVIAFAFGKYYARAAMSLSMGLALFLGLGFLYLLVGFFRGPAVSTGHATALSAVFAATIWNPLFYVAFIGCLLIGIAIVGNRTTPVP